MPEHFYMWKIWNNIRLTDEWLAESLEFQNSVLCAEDVKPFSWENFWCRPEAILELLKQISDEENSMSAGE